MRINSHWFFQKRINRSRYWLLSYGGFILLIGLGVLAFTSISNYSARYSVVVVLAIIYFSVRMILVRLRLNDISPEIQERLLKKGLAGIFGRWMIGFAPSRRERGTSFEEFQKPRLKEIDENPTILLLNIGVVLVVDIILIALLILLLSLRQ